VASGNYSEPLRSEFRKKYLETFGIAPGMVAAFAFDGMNALIHAIRKAGEQDREKIQKALSEISFDGVTGLIQFDERGNRSCKLGIMSVINGFPTTPEKR
jgi:branched-chain amino acid transport system substrate-binding protein